MTRRAVSLLALLLLVPALVFGLRGPEPRTVTVELERTVGLFEGSDVRVLGLRVGKVTRITPHGTKVTVALEYDGDLRLPADVKAAVVAPSVVSDRFVQLTPAYVDGPTLPDGATIALADTRVPVELDRSLATTTDLLTALGPDGANRDGALSRTLRVMADVLDGTGADVRASLRDVATVTDTLAAGSKDLETTVTRLSGFTGTLADYDTDLRSFNTDLASLSSRLAQDSTQLSDLLATLAGSLGEVQTFVQQNRALLVRDVDRLAGVAAALMKERQALAEVLDIAPLAFTNLTETYDAQAQAVRTRANFGVILSVLDRVLCDTLTKGTRTQLAPVCAVLSQTLAAASGGAR